LGADSGWPKKPCIRWVRDPSTEGAILGLSGTLKSIESQCGSALYSKKSITATAGLPQPAAMLQTVDWSMSHYMVHREKSPSCDAACRPNSFTICYHHRCYGCVYICDVKLDDGTVNSFSHPLSGLSGKRSIRSDSGMFRSYYFIKWTV